jgi:hypothetical protein
MFSGQIFQNKGFRFAEDTCMTGVLTVNAGRISEL